MQEEGSEIRNSQGQTIIKLIDYADRSCKKCYGRGYVGRFGDGESVMCACVKRNYRAGKRHTITPETLVKDIVRMVKS